MEIMKSFRGCSVHRYKSNPRERLFASLWQEHNRNGEYDVLALLMSKDGGMTPAEITYEQRLAVNTFVQWLGSPVGWGWLRDAVQQVEAVHDVDKGP